MCLSNSVCQVALHPVECGGRLSATPDLGRDPLLELHPARAFELYRKFIAYAH